MSGRTAFFGVATVELILPGVPLARINRAGRDIWCFQDDAGRWRPLTSSDRRAIADTGQWPPVSDLIAAAFPEVRRRRRASA